MILQLLVNGLALGAAYALVALGFVLVLNATSAVNFAQGDLVVAGGFAAVALASAVPAEGIWLLPLVCAAMAAFGLAFSALAYFPLIRRPPTAVFISTIALGIVIQNALLAAFGPEPRATPALVAGPPVDVAGLAVGRQTLAILAVAALLIAAQHLLLARTQLGRMLRATAQDREMARAIGIPAHRMIALTFALAAALAGAAGLLLANHFFIAPGDGGSFMLKAYIAVTLGGWGSLPGAVIGAMLIALFEVGVAAVLSHSIASAALYVGVLVLLLVRPEGLFGESWRRRA